MTDIHSLYHSLLLEVRDSGTPVGMNLVAFSGGVDSTLVAHVVHEVFPDNCAAVIGVSASLPPEQLDGARRIAAHIGIDLLEIDTEEGAIPDYVENRGMSCYHCKHALYENMKALEIAGDLQAGAALFNGSNADDLRDPTRVGLRAAREHRIVSPLARFRKEEVRALSHHAMLPNWNDAASPCTRSRLALGVPATERNLRRIEAAERDLRAALHLPPSANFRVRHMDDDSAMVEIDAERLDEVQVDLCVDVLRAHGFMSTAKRAFRSGSVSGLADIEEMLSRAGEIQEPVSRTCED